MAIPHIRTIRPAALAPCLLLLSGCAGMQDYRASLLDVVPPPAHEAPRAAAKSGSILIWPQDVLVKAAAPGYRIWLDDGSSTHGLAKAIAREAGSRGAFSRVIEGTPQCSVKDRLMLGVHIRTGQRGVDVVGITAGSEAQRIGLRPGDAIIAVDHVEITSQEQIARTVRRLDPSPSHTVRWVRDGKILTRNFKPKTTKMYGCDGLRDAAGKADYVLIVGRLAWSWEDLHTSRTRIKVSVGWSLGTFGDKWRSVYQGVTKAEAIADTTGLSSATLQSKMVLGLGRAALKAIREILDRVELALAPSAEGLPIPAGPAVEAPPPSVQDILRQLENE